MSSIVFEKNSIKLTLSIGNGGFEEILKKTLKSKLTSPRTKNNWSLGPKTTKLLDVLVVEEIINLNLNVCSGLASDNTDSEGNSISEGKDLKDSFLQLWKEGGVVSMTYKGNTYSVNLDGECSIKEMVDDDNFKDLEITHTINCTLIKGENMTGSST